MSLSGPANLARAEVRSKLVGKARLLIVEDETSLRELLLRAATEWGFSATSASSGEIGAGLNDAHPFDIAILDLILPGMNGIDTLARLRQKSPNVQGIILTGSATIAAAKAAIHLGVVEFLTKPCNRGELEQALERARRRVAEPLPAPSKDDVEAAAHTGPSWEQVERQHILAAVGRNEGDRALTAQELGISRKTLYNKLKEYLRQGFPHPMTGIRLRSAMSRYVTAVAVVALAAVCTRWLRHFGDSGISPLFFAAVLVSAWVGGLGPGLLATGLSGFATAYILFPRDSSLVAAQDVALRLLVFTIVALLASSLNAATQRATEAMHRARDAAEDASAAKTRFLAMVSHELRTPLSSVLMVAEAMENDPSLSRQLRDDAAMIRRCVELETRLIDDLVDLSRIGSGKLHLDRRTLDLHAPLSEAIRFCQNDVRERQLELLTELRAVHSVVIGDPVRLQQVFWNLIRNAIKFTPEGGRIAIRSFNDGDKRVVVQVSDTGIGIEPQRLSLIFHAFEQGGPDITARFGGLGLGLAIAQGLTQAHGGTIHAASEGPNRGSVFTVEFPASSEPLSSPENSITEPLGASESGGSA